MLEHYYVKPSTIDRIRDSWLGSQIENYVGWMESNGYTSRTVFRRLPRLFSFAEFAQRRGCTDVASAVALVEGFVSEWLVQHGAEAKTSASLRKHAIDIGNATRQMLRLASGDPVTHNRHRRPFPLESEVPGFQEYLRSECGLMESTIQGYRHHLHEFGQYLRKVGITSFGALSPALLASFIVECAPGMAPCRRARQPVRPLFMSRQRERLTRFGIYKIVKRHTSALSPTTPDKRRRSISPHVFRHSTAVGLLEKGVDVNVIRAWLGHVSLETTNRYVEITLRTKQAAVEACLPPTGTSESPHPTKGWRDDQELLKWLSSL